MRPGRIDQEEEYVERIREVRDFFCSSLLRCHSSFKEGPGQSALQSAYHNPQWDELN